jgi:hypothetical protein
VYLTADSVRQRSIQQLVEEAQSTFRQELPRLLRTHYLQWALYYGKDRVAIGLSQDEVYAECDRRGISKEECLLQCIVEEAEPLDNLCRACVPYG